MASSESHPPSSAAGAGEEFLDDDDETEPLNDIVIDDDEDEEIENEIEDEEEDESDSDSDADTPPPPPMITGSIILPHHNPSSSVSAAAVTLAIPAGLHPNGSNTTATTTTVTPSSVAVTKIATVDPIQEPKSRQIDDSRKLFQRLWTNEDEIELLKGFLEYTASRGVGHHHDTTAFYDQIKSRLQLDFNKNQLVEKLRRLKKKYRNVVSRISSGKNFVFKSAHDQETFEISCKIWSNSGAVGAGGGSEGVVVVGRQQEFDVDEDQNPNPTMISRYHIHHPNTVGSAMNNNNNRSDYGGVSDQSKAIVSIDMNANPEKMMMLGYPKAPSRKRSRVKMEEKSPVTPVLGTPPEGINVNASATPSGAVNVTHHVQGLLEETVRSCLSPLLKEMINNATNGAVFGGGNGGRGIGGLAMNAIPLNFAGLGTGMNGEVVDGKWRKQQILELEVYSKRLELVQDQIKSTLEELRSLGGS